MNKSEKIDSISAALAKFQQKVKNPKKDTEGYGYKYATLDSVIASVKEAMEGVGLSFSQEVGFEGEMITVTTHVFHNSGQFISYGPICLPKDSGKKMSDVQAAGSAITYARRYSLSAAFGIASEEDDDATLKSKGKNKNSSNKKTGNKNSNGKNGNKATEKQIKAIFAIANSKGFEGEDIKDYLQDMYKVDSSKELTKKQASITIDALNNEADDLRDYIRSLGGE